MKKEKFLIHTTTWMNLLNIMLNNRRLIYHTVEVHLCELAQQAKLIPVEKHSSSFLLKV